MNDLPGLMADISSLRDSLSEELGEEVDIDALVEGGVVALRRRTDLDETTYQLANALIAKTAERAKIESRGIVVTKDVLREAVRRDVETLFNVERLEANYLLTEEEEQSIVTSEALLADYPEVRRSVVNYGVPTFAGRKGSDFDKDQLAREIRSVLQVFEPRLKSDTIRVKVSFAERVGLRIDIDAVLLVSPVPERLRLSTMIDMENGRATTTREDE
ncbi:MAG: type VI secretion system baseplate subunit TssE [Pseudomonadota bacterium]